MRIKSERLKSILRVPFPCFALAISLLCVTPGVFGQAQPKDEPKPNTQILSNGHGTIEFGAQLVDRQGSHDAKFEETRDVPKGIFIQNLRFSFNSANSPFSLGIRG